MAKKLTMKEIIERSENHHPGEYVYDYAAEYKDVTHKICVTCKLHGNFAISGQHITTGRGCPKCGVEKRRLTMQKKALEPDHPAPDHHLTAMYTIVMSSFFKLDRNV